MNIENYIETKYREMSSYESNSEFADLYKTIENIKLREIFTTLHYEFISLFSTMNERLPTNENNPHFWAEPSRSLIKIIRITLELYDNLKESKYAFEIDEYYLDLIYKCNDFLCASGGSTLPDNMQKIDLYYIQPIFKNANSINVKNRDNESNFVLKQIGEGSYANVYRYKDSYYNRYFVVKRAKKDLSDKEIERFKKEYEEMRELSSPYIVDVFRYSEKNNEYIMEYMDYTLDTYITKNNQKLSNVQRKSIAQQVLRAFEYIHSKKRLHRDISPKNILIKDYDDVPVIKVSDFGLVKTPNSNLTTINTEFKGYFNDPALMVEGFWTYNILHETYALTRIVFYILTGKTNTEKIYDTNLKAFVEKGLNPDKSKRFQSTAEMSAMLRKIKS